MGLLNVASPVTVAEAVVLAPNTMVGSVGETVVDDVSAAYADVASPRMPTTLPTSDATATRTASRNGRLRATAAWVAGSARQQQNGCFADSSS